MYSENSKIVICLDSFFIHIYDIWGNFSTYISLLDDFANFPLASFARNYRVTD